MTVFGLNTGIRILNSVPGDADAANSANPSGILYGSIAAQATGTDDVVYVSVYVYTNPERTMFDQLRLRLPGTASTTTVLAVDANGAGFATFNLVPAVAPHGIRVEMAHDACTSGTVDVDLFLMESEHDCSRG